MINSVKNHKVLVGSFIFFAILIYSHACQVPVFRYALERWVSDKYELAIFFNGSLNEEQESLVNSIDINANIEIHKVDAGNMSGSEIAKYGDIAVPDGQILAQLNYPWSVGRGNSFINSDQPVWRGLLDYESLQQIVDSPARKSIREKIISGESAVWVVLGRGDEDKEKLVENKLKNILRSITEKIEIPEGVVGPGELDRVASGEVDVEDVLRSTIPLKISFDVIRIDSNDPNEKIFSRLLTSFIPELNDTNLDYPLIYPVFGRGRTLNPIPASIINEEIMMKACSYICGACSCEVKRENPGIDLIMTAAWQDIIAGSSVVVDKVLPPLTGVADLVSEDSDESDQFSNDETSVSKNNGNDLNKELEEGLLGQFSINWIVGIFFLVILSVISIVSFKLKKSP